MLTAEVEGSSAPHHFLLLGLPPEVYGSISAVETTKVDTGHFLKDPNQGAHLLHLANHLWQVPHPHGASTTMPLATAPPDIIPQGLQYPQFLGVRARAGHPGDTDQQF